MTAPTSFVDQLTGDTPNFNDPQTEVLPPVDGLSSSIDETLNPRLVQFYQKDLAQLHKEIDRVDREIQTCEAELVVLTQKIDQETHFRMLEVLVERELRLRKKEEQLRNEKYALRAERTMVRNQLFTKTDRNDAGKKPYSLSELGSTSNGSAQANSTRICADGTPELDGEDQGDTKYTYPGRILLPSRQITFQPPKRDRKQFFYTDPSGIHFRLDRSINHFYDYIGDHETKNTKKTRNCCYCKATTFYCCSACQVTLCVQIKPSETMSCFLKWHYWPKVTEPREARPTPPLEIPSTNRRQYFLTDEKAIEFRLDRQIDHVYEFIRPDKRRHLKNCVLCYSEKKGQSSKQCSACKVPLCIKIPKGETMSCWTKWHTALHL